MNNTQKAYQLAIAFSNGLYEYLGEAVMDSVIDANANERDGRVCHTHDYCDANQIMIDAWQDAFGEPLEVDASDEAQTDLINLAWGLASDYEFNSDALRVHMANCRTCVEG